MSDAVRVSERAPQPGDVRALERAERLCFTDPWPAQFFLTEMFAPGRFQRLLVDPGGDVVAYLFAAWQYLDLHVLKIAVLPEHRRHGHAQRLMAAAEAHALQNAGETLTLEVRPSNRSAVALYERLGYGLAGRRTRYYPDGEDAVVMTRRLEAGRD
jgi:ribosomal-protein-alanine N-acetyltransferase